MATTKRKRKVTRTTSSKRHKANERGENEPGSGQEQEWAAERILLERRRKGRTEYLVAWEGVDPSTGGPWPPSWEPEENANALLLADWLSTKARPSATWGNLCTERSNSATIRPAQARCTVDSSSEPDSISRQASSLPESIATSQDIEKPVRRSTSPQIPIPERGSSLDREAFDYYSQFVASPQPPSQQSTSQPQTQDTNLDSSQLFACYSPHSSTGVVSDTQSSKGEATFVPSSVDNTGTTQNTVGEDNAEDDEADSGTAEIIEADSVTFSVARSIPETISDSTLESQSQRHETRSWAPIEISSAPCDVPLQAATLSSEVQSAVQEHSQIIDSHVNQSLLVSQSLRGLESHHQGQEEIRSGEASSSWAQAREPAPTAQNSKGRRAHTPQPWIAEFALQSRVLSTIDGQVSQATSTELERSSPTNQIGPHTCQGNLKQTSAMGSPDVTRHHNQPSTTQEQTKHLVLSLEHTINLPDALHVAERVQDSQAAPPNTPKAGATANGSPKRVCENAAQATQIRELGSEILQLHGPSAIYSSKSPVQRLSPRPVPQPPKSQEQNAQVVSAESQISTQDASHQSILPSPEEYQGSKRSFSRENPSSIPSSSQIGPPPHSPFGSLESHLPTRPETPNQNTLTSMASLESADTLARKLSEELEKKKSENPFTPNRSRLGYVVPPSTLTTPSNPNTTSASPLLGHGTQEVDGTRSPSVIPDHVPAASIAPLRTIALSQSAQLRVSEQQREKPREAMDEDSDPTTLEAPAKEADSAPATITSELTFVDATSSDEEELHDAEDDEDASLLNDDLHLGIHEYVVPLFITGRQRHTYRAHVKQKQAILESFLENPASFGPLSELEQFISQLRAIETHFDLVFAEAGSASMGDPSSSNQAQFAARFGADNSIKFKFLQHLFGSLRPYDKHIMLVLDEDDNALLDILDTFCKAEQINYSMPTRGQQGPLNGVKDSLSVTIFPRNTTEAITGTADVIICLDGLHDATQIRQKSWAKNPELEYVPILHLIIPRTVGHIERYLSNSLKKRTRVHTIIASLSQLLGELGSPINHGTHQAEVAAELVAAWLTGSAEDREEWPLVSIGSVKELVQFESQNAQASSPAPERTKRPHDDEELDSAKRMRFTPQPQGLVASAESHENDLSRISDSMRGTALENSSQLRQQIKHLEEALQAERSARKAEAAGFRDQETMWSKQQSVHEDFARDYVNLRQEKERLTKENEKAKANIETLRERIAELNTEKRTLSEQLEQQRATDLLSSDEKTTEITKLRKELSIAGEDKARAQRSQESSDKTLEYMKEQYRIAQDSAAESQASVAELENQIEKLKVAASGQPAKLKKLHLDNQFANLLGQNKALQAENGHLKKALIQKEEELQRTKTIGRMGVGTRATSMTPQPKVRSRAASPMGGRLSNLRNG